MAYIIHYEIVALIVISIVLAFCYARKQVQIEQSTMFVRLAWTIFFSVIVDLAYGIYQSMQVGIFRNVLILLNMSYFIFRVLTVYVFSLYVISITGRLEAIDKKYKLALLSPLLVAIVSVLISPFTGFVFSISQDNEYSRGIGILVTYVSAFLYIAFATIYTATHREVIPLKTQQSIYLFVFLSLFPVAIQFFFPQFLVEGLGIALCALLMYIGVQRPEELQDSDTGLLNNTAWMTVMPASLTVNKTFYVLTVILNEYTTLNKTIGVATLKKIIIRISTFLTQCANGKTLYRNAPNEFSIIIESKNDKDVKDIANDILERFRLPWHYGDGQMRLNIVMCIIECPTQAKTIEQLLSHIETAAVQNSGQKIFYVKDLEASCVKRQNDIKDAIDTALANNSFEVYYQPIYSSVTNKIESAEALIRLNDSVLGVISPEEFIPIAEQSGHILGIGRFVLESVCEFYTANNLKEKGLRYIDVNLSVIECVQDNLTDQLKEILTFYHVDPTSINLEITETAQAYSLEVFKNNVKLIEQNGFKLSLDDYGTGYSTMTYILELPFRIIKLDKSIVWAAFESDKAKQVLKSVISMIKNLGMKIVAEGVETKEQANKLSMWGCDYLQGYYYSKAIKKQDFLVMIETEGREFSL